jgi:hypothetical protein
MNFPLRFFQNFICLNPCSRTSITKVEDFNFTGLKGFLGIFKFDSNPKKLLVVLIL